MKSPYTGNGFKPINLVNKRDKQTLKAGLEHKLTQEINNLRQ